MTSLPDKWVRKAVRDGIHNTEVSYKGSLIEIPCFDTRVTRGNPDFYVLLTTQTNVESFDKCNGGWDSSILIDVVTKYKTATNTASRLLADDITDTILTHLKTMQLDTNSGMKINKRKIDFLNDISSVTVKENVYRKLIRLELSIR